MKKFLLTLAAVLTGIAANAATTYTVTVVYNGTTATVSIPAAISSYVQNLNGSSSHVKLLQTSTAEKNPGEIIYNLSGTSADGEFYMTGEYKATLQLNGLTLNNPDSTAIHIRDGKRIKVSLVTNTTSTLSDGTTDEESKGCLHSKGHTELVGKGTLNISSSIHHAIYSKEYLTIKNCTLNITGAKKDGIHCGEYFLISSGSVKISNVEDDGIQVELKDPVATGQTNLHEDENSGNFYMEGGSLSMSGIGSYCVKAYGNIYLTGGTRSFDTSNIQDHYETAISTLQMSDTTGGRQVYDLHGRQIPESAVLPKGLYIVKEGGKVSKTLVK